VARQGHLSARTAHASAIKEYADMEAAVNSAAGRINGRLWPGELAADRYVNRPHSRTRWPALCRGESGACTPMRDG